jgi:hypothetical protein
VDGGYCIRCLLENVQTRVEGSSCLIWNLAIKQTRLDWFNNHLCGHPAITMTRVAASSGSASHNTTQRMAHPSSDRTFHLLLFFSFSFFSFFILIFPFFFFDLEVSPFGDSFLELTHLSSSILKARFSSSPLRVHINALRVLHPPPP